MQKPYNQQSYLSLIGILVGDPIVNPIPQRLNRYRIAQGLGILDNRHMNAMSTFHRRCLETSSQNWTLGDDDCAETIDYAVDVSGTVFDYDVSINDADFEGIYHEQDVKNYIMNSTSMNDLYKALHIDESTKVPIF
jgi:hypothetical protein